MEVWPSTLPQAFEHDSYGVSPMENRIMTEMDAGPGKQRQRFTATPFIHTGMMVMTRTQYATFKLFVASDLGYAADFYFPNPDDDGATYLTCRFSPTASPPYSSRPDEAPGYVKVSFSLMELP